MLFKVISVLASLLMPAVAMATPMWEQADRWNCEIRHHIKAPIDGGQVAINQEKNFSVLDFAAGTRTSKFVDTVGQIVETRYYESQYGSYNFVVTDWNGNAYPTIFVETNGEIWQSVASGHTSETRTMWIATYYCAPQLTQ